MKFVELKELQEYLPVVGKLRSVKNSVRPSEFMGYY